MNLQTLSEMLFPRKLMTLGLALFGLTFLLLMVLLADLIAPSFGLMFLILVLAACGFGASVIGCTCYLGNQRA